jgi:hypothetical protein
MQLADAYGLQSTFDMLAGRLRRMDHVARADAVLQMLPGSSIKEPPRYAGAKVVQGIERAGLHKGSWRAWASLCAVLAEQSIKNRPHNYC